MKKAIYYVALATMVLVSCGKDKENDNLAQQMIGKWMMYKFNEHIVPTNEKVVYTFESTTTGYLSASRVDFTEDHPKWSCRVPSEVTVEDDKIIMGGTLNKTTSFSAELLVKSISNTDMLTESKYTVYHNGDVLSNSEGLVLWKKVARDYSNDILGVWEGHVTSDQGSEFDDGELHRWEYLDNGNYIYYCQDDNGQWTSDVNEMAQYFVDGTLLCTRWKNTGESEVENREWWEIESIENGTMKWTALRLREDGSMYTATFSMTKVQ